MNSPYFVTLDDLINDFEQRTGENYRARELREQVQAAADDAEAIIKHGEPKELAESLESEQVSNDEYLDVMKDSKKALQAIVDKLHVEEGDGIDAAVELAYAEIIALEVYV